MEIKEVTYKDLFDIVTKDLNEIEFNSIYEPNTPIKVETPTGWIEIFGVVKKQGAGIKIKTASGKEFHGEENHIIMTSEEWKFLKDAKDVILKDGIIDEIISKEKTLQTEFYDISIPNPHSYYSPNGLLHHNTYVVTETINDEGLKKNKD